jgi:anti-sigma B factor antagonist
LKTQLRSFDNYWRMQSFQLSTSELRPGCREIAVAGELDLAVAERMQAALDEAAAAEGCELILVNLERCEFIDSTGIALLVRAHERAREGGGRLAVFGASAQVLRVLSISGLAQNGMVFDDAEAAAAE